MKSEGCDTSAIYVPELKACFRLCMSCVMMIVVCQDEISALRRRLEKSEKERNELRQTADNLETKVCVCVL